MNTHLDFVSNTKNDALRSVLNKVVSEENAENWWKPELFNKNTLSILPAELKIIESVPSEEINYNCFVYVLGLQNYSKLLGNKGWKFTRNLGFVFDEMIKKFILSKIDLPIKGSLIVYRDNKNSISHVGLMKNSDTVISKWSWGPLLEHKVFDVPKDYGDVVEFYLVTQDAIDYVLAKQAGD